jgi:hypothetical protein
VSDCQIGHPGTMASPHDPRSQQNQTTIEPGSRLWSVQRSSLKLLHQILQIIQRPRRESPNRRCPEIMLVTTVKRQEIQSPNNGNRLLDKSAKIGTVSSTETCILCQEFKYEQVHVLRYGKYVGKERHR